MVKKGLLFVFLTAVISGVSIFVNKFGVTGINPYIFTGMKNVAVALLLFSVILLFGDFKKIRNLHKKQWAKLAAIGFFGGSIPFLLFFKGLQISSAAAAAFIHKTMFVYVAVLAAIFLKEKMNKNILLAAVALLIGNALLLKLKWQVIGAGELMILAATLFWATETIISKHTLKELESSIVAFGRMFFGSLFILLFLVATKQISLVATLSFIQISWILLTSVFLFMYVFTWYSGLKYVKAYVATSVLLLGSVITTALSVSFTSAALTLSQALGMLLLVVGVITVIGFSQLVGLVKDLRYILPWSSNEPR
jgi:drug/metabolite transporter (DMT)-like permease